MGNCASPPQVVSSSSTSTTICRSNAHARSRASRKTGCFGGSLKSKSSFMLEYQLNKLREVTNEIEGIRGKLLRSFEFAKQFRSLEMDKLVSEVYY